MTWRTTARQRLLRLSESLVLLITLMIAGASEVQAQGFFEAIFGGNLEVTEVPMDVELDYVSEESLTAERQIVVTNTRNFEEFVEFGFDSASGAPDARVLEGPTGVELEYQIFDENGQILGDLGSQGTRIGGAISANTTQTLPVDVEVFPADEHIPPAGKYDDTVTVRAYDSDGGVGLSEDWEIAVVVPMSVQLALAPPGGSFDSGSSSFTADFGTLSDGAQEQVDVIVRSNTPYSVRIESDNEGALAHTSSKGESETSIQYQLEAEGADGIMRPVALSSGGAQDAVGIGGATGATGRRHELLFEVPEVGGAMSGEYQDVLFVTVEAQ
ncbi:MAG: spore coat protein U domain-containing protein [Spirochaetales bacterium]